MKKNKSKWLWILFFFLTGFFLIFLAYFLFFPYVLKNKKKSDSDSLRQKLLLQDKKIDSKKKIDTNQNSSSLISIMLPDNKQKIISQFNKKFPNQSITSLTTSGLLFMEESILKYGAEVSLLNTMQTNYQRKKYNGHWLVFCDKLSNRFFPSYVLTNENPKNNRIFLFINKDHPLWNPNILTKFCLQSLHQSSHWRELYSILKYKTSEHWLKILSEKELLILLLDIHLNLKQWIQGVDLCERHKLLIKENRHLLNQCGELYLKNKDINASINLFIEAFHLTKNDVYLRRLAQIYLQNGETEKAAHLLNHVRNRKPTPN